ncbi:MAG: mechanosensitive ion channel [Cyanothece sp. SIO2G6]|nr:mechanosensitive ion channel [Cyanothece sp. SIO2G6]
MEAHFAQYQTIQAIMDTITEQTQILWALALMVGCPILSISLGEIVSRLRSQLHPLTETLHIIRVLVLPPLAILLVMLKLLNVSANKTATQVVATMLGLAVMYSFIALVNAILVPGQRRYDWQINVPNLLFQVARVSVILCVAAYLLAYVWQVDLSKVFAALGVGSLVIALALQDTLSNLVSGFLLIFESPFQVGDWVKIKDVEGEILEINWRAVRLKTPDRDVVIIPNGVLGQETIYNYTLLDPSHGDQVTFTFSNEEAPNRVMPILKAAAIAVDGILVDPEPQARPRKVTDHQTEYEVIYYIKDFPNAGSIKGQFITNIYYAAKRHQLKQPVPSEQHYVLHHAPSNRQDYKPDIFNALVALPIFRDLDQDVLNSLSHQATIEYYGIGETIICAGEFDEGVCILLEGQVVLTSPTQAGKNCVITYLEKGDLFGEMALLRNEPSYTECGLNGPNSDTTGQEPISMVFPS